MKTKNDNGLWLLALVILFAVVLTPLPKKTDWYGWLIVLLFVAAIATPFLCAYCS